MVKNAVIVPTGAKGGFFAKQLPNPAVDRGAWMEEGKAAYRIFIRSLLEITDNLVADENGERVVPPANVVRLDGDDTYLVVAADKGTAVLLRHRQRDLRRARPLARATPSPPAARWATTTRPWASPPAVPGNRSSATSPSSASTPRPSNSPPSAWETCPGTCSATACCARAPSSCWLPSTTGTSSWTRTRSRKPPSRNARGCSSCRAPPGRTTTRNLSRAGGGVYSRALKSIPISAEVREALGLGSTVSTMAPNELLRAILGAPVDLLYNGGIGTYVKAADRDPRRGRGPRQRRHPRGRRADPRAKRHRRRRKPGHDPARTHRGGAARGHPEHRRHRQLRRRGLLRPRGQHQDLRGPHGRAPGSWRPSERAGFLHSMTDEVARLVLKTNFDQNVLLLNDKQELAAMSPAYERLMDWLEEHADLDRELEFLPTTEVLEDRLAAGRLADHPGTLGAGGLRQDPAGRCTGRQRPARRPVLRRHPAPLLPGAAGRALRRGAGHPPAAPGDHRHRGRQRHGQHRRHHLRLPGHGGDRRRRGAGRQGLRGAAGDLFAFDEQFAAINALPASFDSHALVPPAPGHAPAAGPCHPLVRPPRGPRPTASTKPSPSLAPTVQSLRPEIGTLLRGADVERVAAWKAEGSGLGPGRRPGHPLGRAVRVLRAAGHRRPG